jgi:hypothetical protein
VEADGMQRESWLGRLNYVRTLDVKTRVRPTVGPSRGLCAALQNQWSSEGPNLFSEAFKTGMGILKRKESEGGLYKMVIKWRLMLLLVVQSNELFGKTWLS